jgi:arginase
LRFAIAAEFDTTGVGLKSEAMRALDFIGVPIDSVGRDGGAEHGPAALRELGLPATLGGVDLGDLEVSIRGEERDPETGILASPDVLATTVAIRAAVAERIGEGARLFLAGGCCAELPGALAGARDALGSVGLVHLDGHLDLYDGDTSPTGEAADMPVSVALGLGPAAWVAAAGGPSLMPQRLALVGFRDQAESIEYGMRQPETIEPPSLQHPVEDLRATWPGIAATAVASILAERGPFWLHIDVDVLDQDVFPATDYLMPNGLNWDELDEVLPPLLTSPHLIGTSLGCYNPDKDAGDACGRALVEALSRSLSR